MQAFPYLVSSYDRGSVTERRIVWLQKQDVEAYSGDCPVMRENEDLVEFHNPGNLETMRTRYPEMMEFSFDGSRSTLLKIPPNASIPADIDGPLPALANRTTSRPAEL